MTHALKGTKQSAEHVAARVLAKMKKNPRKEIVCEICKKIFTINRARKIARFCSKKCFGKHRATLSGNKAYAWKCGSSNTDGYKEVFMGTHAFPRYRLEHHLIMEKKIGRSIKKGEVVHHIDGNKLNNSEDNLVLIRHASAHRRLHAFALRHGLSISVLNFNQSWLCQK